MARVEVVLVRPESPTNVGAAARAVRNAGLDGLVIVEPGDWRTVECWRTAWGAHDVLEQARVAPDLVSAVAGAGYVAALSGRRPAGAPVLDVRAMAAEVAALGSGDVAALVFGPETVGLSDAEVAGCGRRVLIPADAAQPSLNLSHAVMVAAYEVFRARRSAPISSSSRSTRRARTGSARTASPRAPRRIWIASLLKAFCSSRRPRPLR